MQRRYSREDDMRSLIGMDYMDLRFILHATEPAKTIVAWTVRGDNTDTCAKFWPPLLVPSGMTLPSAMAGLSLEFSQAKRSNQTEQLAFGGAPLYTFLNDKKAGDLNGQGVQNIWWAVVV